MRKLFIAVLFLASLFSFGSDSLMAQESGAGKTEFSKDNLLAGSVHPLTRVATDDGPMNSDAMLHGMVLNFGLTAQRKAQLDALVQSQQDPNSPKYHQWITAVQFASMFGPDAQTLAAVSAWLQSQGFSIDHVAESGNAIHFSGSVRQAELAFQTKLHKYTLNGESHFANTTELAIPKQFSGLVINIHGLNDFRTHPKLIRRTSSAKQANPFFTSGISGDHYLSPGDVATIYDINPLYNSGLTGSDQTIGIVGQSDVVISDIQNFRTAAGLSGKNPTVFLIPGSSDPGTLYNGDLQESDLDLEWSGAVAKDASVIFVTSTDVFDSLQYAIQNKINGIQVPILSTSYGACETAWSQSDIAALEADFEQANAQGQTIIAASGDDGAADCDESAFGIIPVTLASRGLQVDYPASSTYVTGVGGTEFSEGSATGGTQYWKSNGGNDVISSALSYIPETAWNDTPSQNDAIELGGFSAGGGGRSIEFTKPSWQIGVPGIPADNARDVPDISFNASAIHDPYLFCTQILVSGAYTGSCTNGFRFSDNTVEPVGGTSVAAPVFAGVLALIEQQQGGAEGNVNPLLYSIASNPESYSDAFHDVTTGNNMVPCVSGSPDCQSSGTLGYGATADYDQVTGLGSLDVAGFAAAVANTSTKGTPSTSIAFSPSNPVIGQVVTMTATVASSSGGATPTGTVSFAVDGNTIQAGITLDNNVATATYTFSTGGSHTITIAYSGDSNYNAVSNSASLSVSASTSAASTTTTVNSNPGTVALGGSLTLTATVTSAAGGTLAGTVSFSLGSVTFGSANVIAGASGIGTATLTVTANSSLGFLVGTNTITATYSGSSQYAQSEGNAAVTVTNPGFTITAGNITIPDASPGNAGSSTITLTSTGGYSGTILLSSSTTDPSLNASYVINPSSVSIGPNGTATATITISAVNGNLRSGSALHYRSVRSASKVAGGGTVLACLIFIGGCFRIRRRYWSLLAVATFSIVVGACLGCGSSGSPTSTHPGTYTITVTGVDSMNNSISNSTNFTLTIQ